MERGENENGLSPPFERTRKCYLPNVLQSFPQFEIINFALSCIREFQVTSMYLQDVSVFMFAITLLFKHLGSSF